jgi:hypothetical protein
MTVKSYARVLRGRGPATVIMRGGSETHRAQCRPPGSAGGLVPGAYFRTSGSVMEMTG